VPRSDVLIIGAGPTGLVLALWLTKLGVKVRIVDKTAEPGTTSRALAVHARTLELYRQLELTALKRCSMGIAARFRAVAELPRSQPFALRLAICRTEFH
jgi:2-polyprenyl-6-methoxyphenol hydroxylase-like FAD-dependent oxidoreductase